MPFDLTLAGAGWMACVISLAAFIRGYSGFGFSALVVAGSALVTNPLHFVPVVLICEFLLSAQSWGGARGHIDWPRVRRLSLGAAIGLPPGLWLLLSVPEETAKILISLVVVVMCILLLAGWKCRVDAGRNATFLAGIASGLANAPGMGGLPVAAFLSAQPIQPAVFRATLIAYFPILDLMSLPLYWLAGLVSMDTLLAAALTLPLVSAGSWLGSKRFFASDPDEFRRFAILVLAGLACLGLLRNLP